jgi:hypothetical protein
MVKRVSWNWYLFYISSAVHIYPPSPILYIEIVGEKIFFSQMKFLKNYRYSCSGFLSAFSTKISSAFEVFFF